MQESSSSEVITIAGLQTQHLGLRACSDDDVLSLDLFFTDLYLMTIDELCLAMNNGNTSMLHQAFHTGCQSGYDLIFACYGSSKGLLERIWGRLYVLAAFLFSGIVEQALCRDATAVQAGASKLCTLGQHHL